MSKESSLVKLIDSEELVKFQKIDEFLSIVNQEPPQKIVKNHPLVSGAKYLPIDKVELLLTKIFQQWYVEILREGQLANSIYVTVRLHYKHPINGWTFQDGVGASPIKTDKGFSAADMAHIKSDAVQTGLPAAESFAVKDAAEKIGTVFGKDLNRKDTLEFTPSYLSSFDFVTAIKNAETQDEFRDILAKLNPAEKKEATPLINERIEELKNGKTS